MDQSTRRSRGTRFAAAVALAAALTLASGQAFAHDHRSTESGHPLRMIAYVVHPIGVILDTLILRPIHWLGSHEPLETLFGHEEDE